MRINKSKLIRFLELVRLRNELENNEIILETSSGLSVTTATKGNICAVHAELGGKFGELEKIGIDNIELLIKVLYGFSKSEELDIVKKENKLLISSDMEALKVSLILKAPEYVINILELEKFNEILKKGEGNSFLIPKNVIGKFQGHCNTLGAAELDLTTSASHASEVYFGINNKENEIFDMFVLEKEIKPFSVKLGKIFLDILSTINDDVIVSCKNNSPVVIYYNKEDYNITYLLAQLKKDK